MAASTTTKDVQLRVKQLREVCGFASQNEMAAFLGISPNRWNNVERGMPLSMDLANILCDKIPGLTIDWLVRGSFLGVSTDLAYRLGAPPMSGPRSPISPLITTRLPRRS